MGKYFFSAALPVITVLLLFTGCATIQNQGDGTNTLPPSENYSFAGTVRAEDVNWNWFFQPEEKMRIAGLETLAREKAEDVYGKDIILRTEELRGDWSPLSLLMLFNTLGFVEEADIEVSVWRKKPPESRPEKPEMPDVKYGIRYVVVPEKNYTKPTEFMTVEYRTRGQLRDELDQAFKEGNFDEKTLQKKISRLPETGRVFITLGREDIANAISRWFTFTCTHEGKTVFRRQGTEDIPYVYGTDRLWWNDKSYDVDPEWDGNLDLSVKDDYQDTVYNFKIVKEKYIIGE